jgi:hypothetical protein
MGLDQYAYSISKHDKNLLDSDEYRDGELAIESEDKLTQWRKHANLNRWMSELAVKKGIVSDEGDFNCQRLWLTPEDIDALEEAVCSAGGLPTGTGFFWGVSTLEDKLTDLDFIRQARKALKQGKEVYYTCWW